MTYSGTFVNDLMRTAERIRCEIDIPVSGDGCTVKKCGRPILTKCADCGNFICASCSEVVKTKEHGIQVMCGTCASFHQSIPPAQTEILDCLANCADVISPKHYPQLVRQIEDLCERMGRKLA